LKVEDNQLEVKHVEEGPDRERCGMQQNEITTQYMQRKHVIKVKAKMNVKMFGQAG